MLDEGRGLAGLERRDEPLGLVGAMGWPALPDAVAADDDEMVRGAHYSGAWATGACWGGVVVG